MPATGEIYVRAMDSTHLRVDGVRLDQWHGPTPCSKPDVKQAATPVVSAPGAMETTCHLSFGDYSGSDYEAQLFMDLLVHGWDIARATGQDSRLDPDLVQACLPIAEQLTTEFRSAGVFGDNLSVSADADPQTKLLALVGRRA
jgi:uncharacterized protein (TIGR03086 family)